MIVKKVKRAHLRHSNQHSRAHAQRLARYVVNAREEDARLLAAFEDQSYARELATYAASPQAEKVLATRAHNFSDDTFGGQLAELDALIAANDSHKDLLDHWVLSWDNSDRPTVGEMFEAFQVLRRCLGVEHCPSIVGLHQDTDNDHGHLAVLRIDKRTGGVVGRAGKGWDIDAAHRSLALIEDRYPSWHRAENRLYEVSGDRLIHRRTQSDVGAAQHLDSWIPLGRTGRRSSSSQEKIDAKIDMPSRQYEEDTGWMSRKRVALEQAVPILKRASSWQDAHRALAQVGIGLELAKNKTGANFLIDGKPVKASIHDATSLPQMKKRLGDFECRPVAVTVMAFQHRPMYEHDVQRQQYFRAKRSFTEAVRDLIADVRAADHGYRSSLPRAGNDPIALMRSSFPSFEAWRNGARPPVAAEVLASHSSTRSIMGLSSLPVEPQRFDGFQAEQTARGIAYKKVSDLYSRPSVFDAGSKIYVNDNDEASIRVALRLANARLREGTIKPFGPPEFKEAVERIARSEGILTQQGKRALLRSTAPHVAVLAEQISPSVLAEHRTTVAGTAAPNRATQPRIPAPVALDGKRMDTSPAPQGHEGPVTAERPKSVGTEPQPASAAAEPDKVNDLTDKSSGMRNAAAAAAWQAQRGRG